MPLFYLDPWRVQSKARTENQENFKAIHLVNQMVALSVPLKAGDFVVYANALDAELKKVNKAYGAGPYTVNTSETFSTVLEAYRKPSENLVKEISNSPYIQEAFHILCDMIATKK